MSRTQLPSAEDLYLKAANGHPLRPRVVETIKTRAPESDSAVAAREISERQHGFMDKAEELLNKNRQDVTTEDAVSLRRQEKEALMGNEPADDSISNKMTLAARENEERGRSK